MKKIIIVSVLIGVGVSLFLYFNYKNNNNEELAINSKIYMLQIGAYKNYENVSKITKTLNSYVIEEQENLHHVYVGLTGNEKNIDKIKAFYEKNGDNIYVRVKNIDNEEFMKKLSAYDYMISSAESKDAILTINKEILKTYEELKHENKGISK